MIDTYALILNGVIANTVLASPGDPMDPTYTWAVITNTPYCVDGVSPVQIGCTTLDNVTFTAAQS